MNQDNMLFGQLNQEIELLEYIGEDTDTAKVTVDGKAQAIAVDVKKVPNKLVITEDSTGETLIHEFDGSSETLVDLTGYAKEEATQEKLDAKRDKIVRDETQDPQYTLVYSQNTNGVESSIPTTTSAVAGSIPIRNANGNLIGYQAQGQEYTPFSQVDAIAKTKVAKITIPSGNPAKVYGANSAGETSIPVDKSALADAIAWRNAKGNLVGNDATADNEYTILSQVNAITQKEVADLGADIDGRLYEVEEDVQTKYDNSVHRTKLPSDQAARVYTEYWDTATGTSKQGSTEYSRSAQPGYFAVRTSNGQLNAPDQSTYEPSDDQFVSKRFTSAHYVPINGNSTITGNLAITGDLAVSGTTTTESEKQLFVEANVIATNANKIDLKTLLSGLAINKNPNSTYGIMYDPTDDTVKFGEGTLDADNKFVFNTGEGHPLAIRADSSKFTDAHLVKWDAASMSFVDAGAAITDPTDLKEVAVVQRDTSGQINLPDQTQFIPCTNQAIAKVYADSQYFAISDAPIYGTQAWWEANDNVITKGRIVFLEKADGRFQLRVGDGTTHFTDLPAIGEFRVDPEALPFGTLESGYDYRIGNAEGVEYFFPETIPDDFHALVSFNSGAEATVLYTDDDCVFTGDDCSKGIFTPISNKKYTVFFWYDGTKQAIVRGIPTDGNWPKELVTPTIGTSTSSTDLKKIVYTADADIPATPEEGVEYAVTDFISEADLDNALATKINNAQEKLTFDTTPTADSTNPVTSDGIYKAIADFLTIQVSNTLVG